MPTCPDWDADDLLWHLAEVQWFWGMIVGRGLTTGAQVDALVREERPVGRERLLAHFDRASSALRYNDVEEPSWGELTLDPTQTVRVRTVDTGRSWLLTLARLAGVDDDGTAHDEPAPARDHRARDGLSRAASRRSTQP